MQYMELKEKVCNTWMWNGKNAIHESEIESTQYRWKRKHAIHIKVKEKVCNTWKWTKVRNTWKWNEKYKILESEIESMQ